MRLFVAFVLLGASAVDAQSWWSSWFGAPSAVDDSTPSATWNGLKVTFGVNPFGSNFDRMPRTTEMAEDKGWTLFGRNNCSAGTWQGFRYVKDNDPAVILLFDTNGYIAGIQMGVDKSELPADGSIPPEQITPPWIEDEDKDMLLLTAYFIEPSKICSDGRTEEDYQEEGTGTDLFIQTGPNSTHDVMAAPHDESDMGDTVWTRGNCFYGMGQHYWYNFTADMVCEDFYPVFLLYNSGKLDGFGWNINTVLDSPRYESPPTGALGLFFEEKPPCFDTYVGRGLSTLHVYLDDSPSSNFC